MIKVDRGKVIPKILGTSGKTETDKAIANFSKKGKKKPFAYSVYKNSEVKNLLKEIFNKKCAYCESPFLAVYPGDVEHFRPKGEVIEKIFNKATKKYKNRIVSEKGYYWLGAYWDNLLLSCKLCNQEQTYQMPDNSLLVLGKKNQFPLRSGAEKKRLTLPDIARIKEQIDDEDMFRLILDPCKDDPAAYFKYDEKLALIVPKSATGDSFLKASESIRVYALQRMPLVDARKEVLVDIQAQQQRILELHEEHKKVLKKKDMLSVTKQIFFEKRLLKELDFLRVRYLRSSQPYLGMSRYVIGKFLKEYFNIDI